MSSPRPPKLIAALLIFFTPFAPAQLAPHEAAQSFQTADDIRLELVAAEPLVASPCALSFDEKGRLFVAENRGYPNTETPPQGTIALLEDADGDGRFDRRFVFADGLSFPNGVLAWRGGVIVTCAPDVLFLRDTDGDGRADERRVLLTGFDTTKSTQLRVNAPTLGPDGWIYLAAGLAGGTIAAPEHPDRAPLKMTADVRFHPDTLEVENVDGKSQFGMSFDDFGRRFICMNRLPVQHVVLSSKWLARNPRLAFSDTVQDCNERSVKTGLKGGGDGVRLFPISANITTADSHAGSFSAACGVHIWRGGALPARYDGAAFSCDSTGNLIHVDRLEPRGATFTAVPLLAGREFVAARDDFFRPVFLTRGPEGALYVADMYRRIIEHPDYLPDEVRKHTDFETGKMQGRIWRITGKQARPVSPLLPFRDQLAAITLATTAARSAAELPFAEELAAPDTAPSPANLVGQPYQFSKLFTNDPNEVTGEVRSPHGFLDLAIALGDSRADFALPALAALALREMEDRWMRAAVLSGLAGREIAFLRAVAPKLKGTSEGELELLSALGRSCEDAAGLLAAVGEMGGIGPSGLAALLGEMKGAERMPAFQTALTAAAKNVSDAATPPAARLLFARLLARSSWADAAPALQQTLAVSDDEVLRTTTIRSLAALDAERAAAVLLAPGAWAGYSPALRESVLGVLLTRAPSAAAVLAAIEAGDLPAAALAPQRRQIFLKHADAGLRERAARVFAAAESSRATADAKAQAALALAPQASHGRAVFQQLCATCHRLDREGVAVGPDLLDIRKQTKANIVFHIVAPDAEIAPAFTAYTCETKDGRAFAGLLTSETPTSVTIRQPGGAEESVLRGEIKSLVALPGSLMPTGLDAAMTPQNLADLLAFLKGEQ